MKELRSSRSAWGVKPEQVWRTAAIQVAAGPIGRSRPGPSDELWDHEGTRRFAAFSRLPRY